MQVFGGAGGGDGNLDRMEDGREDQGEGQGQQQVGHHDAQGGAMEMGSIDMDTQEDEEEKAGGKSPISKEAEASAAKERMRQLEKLATKLQNLLNDR